MITNKNILIYTGPIKSGKSSRLYDFSKNRKGVAGILSLVIDNKKYLYSIRTKEQRLLEVNTKEKNRNVVSVGKYFFDENVFKWAKEILKNDLREKPDLIILDEIGPLELSGKGLAPTAFEIIKKSLAGKQKVVVVLRESFVIRFLEYFELNDSDIDYFTFNSFV